MASDIQRLMRFWNSGDESLARELFHPNVMVRAVLQEVRGVAAYAAFVRSFNTSSPAAGRVRGQGSTCGT